jgi:hypothetical protein
MQCKRGREGLQRLLRDAKSVQEVMRNGLKYTFFDSGEGTL